MKINICICIVLSMLLATAQISFAAAEKKCAHVKDAERFWEYNMPTEAMSCLDAIISREPADTKAHFVKGAYCLKTGNLACAESRFQAKPVRDAYRSEISKLYKAEAASLLENGDDNRNSILYYTKAFEYGPGLQEITLQELFTSGRALAMKGQYEAADRELFIASYFSASFGNQACDIFYGLGNSMKIEEALYFYDKARKYCTDHNEEIGRMLLQTAKSIAKIPEMEKQTDSLRNEAIKYLGEKKVLSELPSYKICNKGTYLFSLKKGEQSDHWVMFPEGMMTNFTIGSSDDKFELLYDDGQVVPVWTPEPFPQKIRTKFKIVAVTDQQEIRLVVK
ncbi:MAG: hypothetical protein HYS21_09005 [Deltaproteobacteria bacterium]|nr:hypothetical protein [Deltaproteobacteria bacterium]